MEKTRDAINRLLALKEEYCGLVNSLLPVIMDLRNKSTADPIITLLCAYVLLDTDLENEKLTLQCACRTLRSELTTLSTAELVCLFEQQTIVMSKIADALQQRLDRKIV